MIPHVRLHCLDRLVVQDVDLVDDQKHFLAPLPDLFQKDALALRKRTVGRRDEHHQIAAWDEVLGDLLVLADDRVGARCVDDVDLFQDGNRLRDANDAVYPRFLPGLLTEPQYLDLLSGRRDAFL